MKISIVTISYNQANYIERTIKSIIEQDYEDKEYIIVDPGSDDGSRDIIEKYRDHIDTVIYEKDQGPADGLNRGFSRATGDIWYYLNADDTLLPGTLRKVNECFNRYPDADVISAHGYVIDEQDNVIQRFFSHPFSLTAYATWCCFLMQQSTFFKPDIFRKINGFNKSNKICWDGELMVDFALAGAKFRVIRDNWACFRIHTNSITVSDQYRARLDKEHLRIRNKILENGYKPFPRPVEWLKVRISDPLSTVERVIDGIINSDRKL